MYLNLLNPGFSSTGFPFHFSKLVFFRSFQQDTVGRAEANSEASGNRKSIVVNFICRGVEELGEFLMTVLARFAWRLTRDASKKYRSFSLGKEGRILIVIKDSLGEEP